MSLVPCNTACLLYVTDMVCWLKLASHLESHSLPIDMRELCTSPGNMWASFYSSGKVVNAILHP